MLRITGVTYRRLDYWTRTGLVGSSIREASGRGSRRVYSFEDLVALRVVARLLRAGISLQAIRRAVKYLRGHTRRPLSTLGLISHGNKLFALTQDPAKMIEAIADGQVVIAIAVEPIVKALETEVGALRASHEGKVTVAGRSYRIVMTPDLEAGGFTVSVPDLPGCLTEGETLAEAKAMARDAIAAWTRAQAARTTKRLVSANS